MKKYSVIVPVYNRPQEAKELLDSLSAQTCTDFELILVEDGSTEPCDHLLPDYADRLTIHYHFKPNSGPGDSRNYGMSVARGEYLIFFDSDCVIPPQYFQVLTEHLAKRPLDAFGGPDAAHESFSDTQKAINHAMTSFITTGGIRGREMQLDKFQPRSFNMGMKRIVYERVGGFANINPGEDPDLSYRIMDAGFTTGLVPEAFVYHKRRIDFRKFYNQVHKFGIARVILMKWHPGKTRAVYFLPALFVTGAALLLLCSLAGLVAGNPAWAIGSLLPLALLTVVIWIEAAAATKDPGIAFRAVAASYIQLIGYGWGFLKALWKIMVVKQDEQKAFPRLFFKQ